MREVEVEEVVVQDATHHGSKEGSYEAQENRSHRVLLHRLPAVPGPHEEESHHQEEHNQPHQAHLLGHEEVDAGHADVEVDVGRCSEADAEPRVATDEAQGVLVLAEAHPGGQVLPPQPLDETHDVKP